MTTQAKIFLAVLILIATLLNACNAKKKKLEEERRIANERVAFTSTGHALIVQDAKGIKDAGGKIRQLLGESPPNPPLIIAQVQGIEDASDRIRDTAKSADALTAKTKKALEDERERNKDLLGSRDKGLFNWLTAFIVAGILMIVAGTFAAAVAGKLSLAAGPTSILAVGGDFAMCGWLLAGISLSFRLGIKAITPYEWIPGLTLAITLAVAIVYFGIKAIKRVRLKRAFTEVVETGERVRDRPDVPTDAIIEEAGKVQSPATMALVQEAKKEIKQNGGTVAEEADISPPP